MLTGHEQPISALAFSAAGEHLASVSATERSLRWWAAGSQGFFGFLGLQSGCIATTPLTRVELPTQAPLGYGLEWTGASRVVLKYKERTIGTYDRPG